MKIENIKKTGASKYRLYFEDGSKISLYDDVIINNNILYKKDIDQDLINKLNQENNYYDVYNKVIKYITIRIRSKKEINDYIDKFDLDEKEKNRIIAKLDNNGLINDRSFARAFVYDKLNLSNNGPLKIRNELVSYGINEEIIEEAMSDIDDDFVKEKLSKLIIKKINQNHTKSKYMINQKIIVDMISLGYLKEDILDVLDSIDFNDSDIIKKDYEKLKKKYQNRYNGEELRFYIKNKLYQKGYSQEKIEKVLE